MAENGHDTPKLHVEGSVDFYCKRRARSPHSRLSTAHSGPPLELREHGYGSCSRLEGKNPHGRTQTHPSGCFCKFGVLFAGVLIRATFLGSMSGSLRVSDVWKLPNGRGTRRRGFWVGAWLPFARWQGAGSSTALGVEIFLLDRRLRTIWGLDYLQFSGFYPLIRGYNLLNCR